MCDFPHHLASFWLPSPLPLSERATNPKEIFTILASYNGLHHLPIFRKVWVLGSLIQCFNSKMYLLGFHFLCFSLLWKFFGRGKNTWWVFLYRNIHLPFPEMSLASLLLNPLHENVFWTGPCFPLHQPYFPKSGSYSLCQIGRSCYTHCQILLDKQQMQKQHWKVCSQKNQHCVKNNTDVSFSLF